MNGVSEQVPPQNIEAEESTLGAMLVAEPALRRVLVESGLTPKCFYLDKHRAIYAAIQKVAHRDGTVDELTVGHELPSFKHYVSELAAKVPAAGNALHYARIVASAASLRMKLAGAQEIQGAVYELDEDKREEMLRKGLDLIATDLETQAEPTSEEELADDFFRYLDEEEPAEVMKLPFTELNECVFGGYRRGQTTVVAGWTEMGKALDIDTPVPTPSGWTTMGQLKKGDEVFDESGRPTQVLHAFAPMEERPCFQLTFSDGSTIVADAEHEWKTWDRAARRRETGTTPAIRTTEEIYRTVMCDHRFNHSIPLCAPLGCSERKLPVAPYTLGVWLGDGTSCRGEVTTADMGVVEGIERDGYTVVKRRAKYLYGIPTLIGSLRDAGVLGNKHIPLAYLRAGVEQRMELLRGLVDSDGHVSKLGGCELTTTSADLARGYRELLLGLGFHPVLTEDRARFEGRDCGPRYRIRFAPNGRRIASLSRKQDRVSSATPTTKTTHRRIVDVRPVPTRTVRCIHVDSPSHLFLAGEGCVPTHNSWWLDQMIAGFYGQGYRCAIFATEMDKRERVARFIQSKTGVAMEKLLLKKLTDNEMARAVAVVPKIPFSYFEANGWPAERICQQIILGGYDVVAIDVVNLIPGYEENQEATRILSRFMEVARRANCHVILVSHLNRARATQAKLPRPVKRDLRDSGMLETNAAAILFVHREQDDKGEPLSTGEIYFEKIRNGMKGGVNTIFVPTFARFELDPDAADRKEDQKELFS